MAFSQQDNHSIDFICILHARAPNLTASQILERCRINFGRHPSMKVQNWLYKSVADFRMARENSECHPGLLPFVERGSSSSSGLTDLDQQQEKRPIRAK
ncbi:hypothetical protein PG993_007225 [Apiospora rasikravindrae]|uniref:Uncharacterized protein n=1 Tax=Apiospora rasikravindrae TaxID=990691 RepID=A0ABR1SWX1_9PEZI